MDLATFWEISHPRSCSASLHSLQLDPTKTLCIHNTPWQGVWHVPKRGVWVPLPLLGIPVPASSHLSQSQECKKILFSGSQAMQLCLNYCLTSWEGLLSHRHQVGENSCSLQIGETLEVLYCKSANTRNVLFLWKQSRFYLSRFLHDS